MDTLPPELLLYFISFLPLTSLISARGVDTQWRSFAQTAPLHPARKVLVNLYLAAIIHPNFPSLIAALQPHIHEFDREAYIADLTSRGCVLPDLFELWILEWPTKATHFWAWPGLTTSLDMNHKYFHDDTNPLGETTPIIETISVPKKEVAAVGHPTCQGLLVWEIHLWSAIGVAQLWLVVDANNKINDRRMGRLLWTYSHYVSYNEPGPKKIFYDTPLGPPTNFRLIEFLDLLDLCYDQVDDIMAGYYYAGSVRLTDDGE